MFIAALFTIAKIWKQPKCPSTDEWIKKMWYIYKMEYYSAMKVQNNAIRSHMDRTRDSHIKWSKSERERQIPYDITYMCNLKYGTDESFYNIETDSQTWRADVWLPRGRERRRDWEFGVSRCKLLHLERISIQHRELYPISWDGTWQYIIWEKV